MRLTILVFVLILSACDGNSGRKNAASEVDTALAAGDSLATEKIDDARASPENENQAFRQVQVEKTGPNQFRISGEARVFEATFNWVVEDGHNELKKGFETASTGAPGWGSFAFTVEVEKERPNSTLMLILFEESAKDGSRVHELPVRLE